MKVSKAGIRMYEDSDPAPEGSTFAEQVSIAVNLLRKEINKMAEVIDRMQEEIDELKKR